MMLYDPSGQPWLVSNGRLLSAAANVAPRLVETAAQGGVLDNYGNVNAEYVRMPSINNRQMGLVLDPVARACAQIGAPDITAQVISKTTGRPGNRFANSNGDPDHWRAELDKYSHFDWPSLQELSVLVKVILWQRK